MAAVIPCSRSAFDDPAPYEPKACWSINGSAPLAMQRAAARRRHEAVLAPAVAAARDADVTVLVVGLGTAMETEDLDRYDLALPRPQQQVLDARNMNGSQHR